MQQGLSLIELLIVVAVSGILAAIAYPAYNEQLRRAARSEAVGLLHEAALRLERHHARSGQYSDTDQHKLSLPADSRYYRLQLQRDDASFRLQAQRLPTGLMAQDQCADYQLDQAGVRSNPGSQDAADCWSG